VHINICLSLDFHTGFLQREVRDMKYDDSVSAKLSHWVIGFFHNIIESHPSFSIGFLRVIRDNWTSIVQAGVLKIKSSLHLIIPMNSAIQRRRMPIRAHEAWMNSAFARTVAGGERPHPFTAAPIHPLYMYKRRQEINKEYIDSLSYN
jgi:hypothetical protein